MKRGARGMRIRTGLACMIIGVGASSVSAASTASAASFRASCAGTTGSVASLVAAIDSANAAPGPDTVSLGPGCTYALSSIDNYWYGPNGLPAISSPVTIQGNGSTITRGPGAPSFRLFFVGADPAAQATAGFVSPAPAR